jgi:pilus assembly protein CpaE
MFDLLEYAKEQRVVVLNRADARVGLTPADIERVVRAPILGHVPSTRDVPVSINRGVPLVVENAAHPVSRAIREIAEARLGAAAAPAAAADATQRRRSFSLRRGR